jgi:hypothetical protein
MYMIQNSIIQISFLFLIMFFVIKKVEIKIMVSLIIAGCITYLYFKWINTNDNLFIIKMTAYLDYFKHYKNYKHLYKNANLLTFLYDIRNNKACHVDITNKTVQFLIAVSKNQLDIADALRKDILNIFHSYIYIDTKIDIKSYGDRLEYLLLEHMGSHSLNVPKAYNNTDSQHEFYL